MSELPTAELGRTGVTVTRLGYGTMGLAGGGKSSRARDITPAEAAAVLNAVLDAGINLIDTSPDYGEAEAAIGAAIAHRRDEYFLASKCGCPVNQPPPPVGERQPHVFTRQNVRAGVEQSLTRMRTDHLDLVQIHHSPSRQVLERDDSLAELEALRDEGKIRFIGMSATLPHIEDHIDMGVFDTFQIPYSVVEPDHEAWISNAAKAGAGTIVRGGVARGVTAAAALDVDGLTGPSQASLTKKWELWTGAGLRDLLGDSMGPVEFMLRATLAHPDLTTTIVGTASQAHLADNVAAALAGPLPDDVHQEVKRRVAAVSG